MKQVPIPNGWGTDATGKVGKAIKIKYRAQFVGFAYCEQRSALAEAGIPGLRQVYFAG